MELSLQDMLFRCANAQLAHDRAVNRLFESPSEQSRAIEQAAQETLAVHRRELDTHITSLIVKLAEQAGVK